MIAQAIILAVFAGLVIFLVWAVFGGEEKPEVKRIRKLKEEKGYEGGIIAKTSSGKHIWISPDLVREYKSWKKHRGPKSILLNPWDESEPYEVIGFHYGPDLPLPRKKKDQSA